MPPAHVRLQPAWQPAPPAYPGALPGATSTHYHNPDAPPGEILAVTATIYWKPDATWGYTVTITTCTAQGTAVPLYPYSGWGGTAITDQGARNVATRKARALVHCASQGLPVP
jgi:hypothetical protein